MTDGFARNGDDRFGPLTEAEHSTAGSTIIAPEEEETAILNPVAMIPRRIHHREHGFPSQTWRYMTDSENVALVACRFNKPNGSKTFAPSRPGAARMVASTGSGNVRLRLSRPTSCPKS